MKGKRPKYEYLICVQNRGYQASLEKRKLYVALPDGQAEKRKLIRVIDESGEDYLYPRNYFRQIELSTSVRRAAKLLR
jgi:hypothetical protein